MADVSDAPVRLIGLAPSDDAGLFSAVSPRWIRLAAVACAVAGVSTLLWFERSPARRSPVEHAAGRSIQGAPSHGGPASAPPAAPLGVAPPTLQLRSLSPAEAFLINAATLPSRLPVQAALPFRAPADASQDYVRARDCLTAAVYYEAALESTDGQRAVAQVVLNRVRHPAYPKTVCGVVYQGSNLPTGCQFTFTCDGSLGRKPVPRVWARAQAVAEKALNGDVMATVGTATHYHTVWVVPYWSPTLVKIGRIGAHIFYRWTGSMGALGAFQGQYSGLELNPSEPPAVAAADGSAANPAVAVAAAVSTTPEPIIAQPAEPEPALAPLTPAQHVEKAELAHPDVPKVTPTPASVANGETRQRPRLAMPDG